jgi:hypothetical protein
MARRFLHTASAACVLALSWASFSPTAQAYRTFADDPEVGVAARHRTDVIRWDLYTQTSDPARDATETAALASYATWASPPCTNFEANYGGLASMPAAPGDGRNTIEIVRTGWAARGFPSGRGATTDVQLSIVDVAVGHEAEIREADIYINFEEYGFGMPGAMSSDLDLQGVLTHEIGHQAIGLQHPCEIDTAPACSVVPEARLSTMYPTYLGESQRVLGDDDLAGVCQLYPSAGCPMSCGIARLCGTNGTCVECSNPDCRSECTGPTCTPEAGVACSDRLPCAQGVCAGFADGVGTCAMQGALGTPCAEGSQCDSRICIRRTNPAPAIGYCTTRCATDAECPGAQTCGTDGVCRPLPRSSCSIAQGTHASRFELFWLGVLGLMLRAQMRRRGES